MKRGVFVIGLLLLVIATPVSGVTYDRVSYISGDTEIFVEITANTPWRSPFSETVNVSVDVVPTIENVLGVNITRVTLIVLRAEADSSGYNLITLETDNQAHIVSNNPYANYTNSFSVSESKTGTDCYLALVVEGNYENGTHNFNYQAQSPDNLVGPFEISASMATPTVWVGLLAFGIASLVFIAGMYGIKKSKSRVRRKSLLDE
ncbi:MAG: hypothetical protein ACTSV2_16540 [Candidatus Thorarchaeota archaeon]